MKSTIPLLALIFCSCEAFGQAFITTWKTNNPGKSASNQITIPTIGTGYSYSIYWEHVDNPAVNGTIAGPIGGNYTIIFPAAGTYRVHITGAFPRIYFNAIPWEPNTSDHDKILTVEQWGNIVWGNMSYSFSGCKNLKVTAIDAPNLSQVTNMDFMFVHCESFNEVVNHWDVSQITSMNGTFGRAVNFNQFLDGWNVGNVKSMRLMFSGASSFNQKLKNWNVSQVTDMSYMFSGAINFNQPINDWDVSQVTDMDEMFRVALAFDQALDHWNVGTVTDMNRMFEDARNFNQPIGTWNVSNVLTMENMFYRAASFNQPIEFWNVGNVISMRFMFAEAKNFNQPIGSWRVDHVVDMSGMFQATNFNFPIEAWNVGNVRTMAYMFAGDSSFNQPIGGWDVKNVTNMNHMFGDDNFGGARNFNQPIDSWDVSNVTSMAGMFQGASKFNQPIGNWNVSNVTDMSRMFQGAVNFNQPIGGWNVSKVTNMSGMFNTAINFNQSLADWNVSRVSDMSSMFGRAENFNQPIGTWNVSKVTDMSFMFGSAQNFNQPIGSWNVSSVTDMGAMFVSATNFNQPIVTWDVSSVKNMSWMFGDEFNLGVSFNQPIEAWDVSSVTDMSSMFERAAFNQSLEAWNVSNVTNMSSMFRISSFNQPLETWDVGSVTDMSNMLVAPNFNQPIGAWDITSVTDMFEMLTFSGLNVDNYDQTLIGWAAKNVKPNVPLGAAGLKYCLGAAARAQLVSKGWVITRDISLVPSQPVLDVIQVVCYESTGTITVTIQNPNDTYSFDGGATFQSSPIRALLTPGPYSVIIKNELGCSSFPQHAVINNPFQRPPTPILSGSPVVCPNTLAVDYSANNTGYSYQWFISGGSIQSQQTNHIKVNWGPSNFNSAVKAVGFDERNCPTDTAIFPVKIQIKLKPALPSGFDSVCYNFRTSVPYQTSYTNGSIYTWFTNGGLVAEGQSTSQTKIDWADVGEYQLWLKEENTTSTDYCEGFSDTLNVIVFKDLAAITMNFVSVDYDDDKNVQLQWEVSLLERVSDLVIVSRRIAGSNAPWEVVVTLEKNVQSFLDQHVATSANVYEYKVEGFNKCDEGLQTVIHNTIKLDGDKVEEEELINLDWNDYNGWNEVEHYEVWRKLDNEPEFKLIDVTPGDLTTYSGKHGADGFVHHLRIKAKKKGANIISWSNELKLDFENPIDFIPNVITPNDDSNNDIFIIPKLELYPDNALIVYDRWGEMVFSKRNYDNTWEAEGLTNGVYFYSLIIYGVEKKLKGWLHVIR